MFSPVLRALARASAIAAGVLPGVAPARAEVVIASAGPMSGTYARIGGQIRAGVEAAVAAINLDGGVLGETLRAVSGDDSCRPDLAINVARSLATQNARLVVGHACSAASAAASEVYAESRVVQISPAATAPDFTDKRPGPGVFRLAGRDDRQAPILGAALAERFKNRRIAFLHDGTAYGDGLAEGTRLAMNAAGATEILDQPFEAGATEHASVVSALRAARADVIFVGAYAEDAAILRREIAAAGLAVTVVGGDALIDPEYAAAAGNAADGTIFAAMPDPTDNPDNADIVARLRAAGAEPAGYTLYAYAAVQAWAAAAKAADSTGFDAVSGALAVGQFATVLGEVDFDDIGDATLPDFILYQWREGRVAPLPAP